MSRATTQTGRPAWLTIAAIATAAGLCTSWPELACAAKPQPSPFAGCYGDGVTFLITIDDSGRISGSGLIGGSLAVDYSDISGSISETGVIKLTLVETFFNLDSGRIGRLRYEGTGLGALDDVGNLFGVLEVHLFKRPNGDPEPFFWPPCQ